MRTDLHIHTCFSSDSEADMQACCEAAVERGLSHICFTDHLEHNPHDGGTGYYRPEAYFNEVRRLQQAYKNKITVLTGVEFAEPHLYRTALAQTLAQGYDLVLGSVHWIDDMAPYEPERMTYSTEKMFQRYWAEMERAVETGGFQVLSHMDFPKRYCKQCFYEEDTILRILKKAVQQGIVMEINASTLRQGFDEPMPSEAFVALYKEAGGTWVSIGSDSHYEAHVGADVDRAAALADRYGLRPCWFSQKKAIPGAWG
ncbi:MAG: histidinol-phosphatase HisJ family protein [Clostridiales bacterium]|nr:histidinol-phosphatase HisJ family protein [Clostridiales bacterium]